MFPEVIYDVLQLINKISYFKERVRSDSCQSMRINEF